MSEEKNTNAEDRMSDGGIFMIGDEVIHDGEAKSLGIKPRRRVVRRKTAATWPDVDD
jgi:hypothetical protein